MSGFRLPVRSALVIVAATASFAAAARPIYRMECQPAPPIDIIEGKRTHRPKSHGYAKIRRAAKKRRRCR